MADLKLLISALVIHIQNVFYLVNLAKKLKTACGSPCYAAP